MQDSPSLVQTLASTKFPKGCILFTVDFKSLYTNIPVDIACPMICELLEKYPNTLNDCVGDLLKFVLHNNIMEFDKNFFQQIMGIVMGTHVAPILANIFLAICEIRLKEIAANDPNFVCPLLLSSSCRMLLLVL